MSNAKEGVSDITHSATHRLWGS